METGKMKLALSAGAIALSMALAGCGGGGSSTAGIENGGGGGDDDPPQRVDCGGGVMAATSAGCAAALEAANQANETAFETAGGTPGALLDEEGDLHVSATNAAALPTKLTDRIEGLYDSVNLGMKWHQILNAKDTSLGGGTGKAIKVTGKYSDWFTAEYVEPSTDAAVTGASHKGFTGSIICTDEDCNVPSNADAEFA